MQSIHNDRINTLSTAARALRVISPERWGTVNYNIVVLIPVGARPCFSLKNTLLKLNQELHFCSSQFNAG